MMEELSGVEELATKMPSVSISDQLLDAAHTNVTQAPIDHQQSPFQNLPSVSAPLLPPSQLPNYSADIKPPSDYPFTTPAQSLAHAAPGFPYVTPDKSSATNSPFKLPAAPQPVSFNQQFNESNSQFQTMVQPPTAVAAPTNPISLPPTQLPHATNTVPMNKPYPLPASTVGVTPAPSLTTLSSSQVVPPSPVLPSASTVAPPPTTGYFPSPKGMISGSQSRAYMATSVLRPAVPANSSVPPSTPPSDMTSPNQPFKQMIPSSTDSSVKPFTPVPPASPVNTGILAGQSDTSISVNYGDSDNYSNTSMSPVPQPYSSQSQGLFGWIGKSEFVHKVVEKTKTLSENMIATLDPGMKEIIRSGGALDLTVASSDEIKVSAVRQAFQDVFGMASVSGKGSEAGVAPQPVGYTAALKGAEERIDRLRRSGALPERSPAVSFQNFIVELLPDMWYDMGCVILRDPANQVALQTFTQPTPLPAEHVIQAMDATPADYPLRWSGLSVSVGSLIDRQLPGDTTVDSWYERLCGVSQRHLVYLAAKQLAFMYQQRLPSASTGSTAQRLN